MCKIFDGRTRFTKNDQRPRFRELCDFKKRFGHCRVPRRWKENPALGRWMCALRSNHPRLTIKQLKRLFRLGFDFGRLETRWIRQFLQLVHFKKRYGHCNVPARWKGNPTLARWVDWQRRRKMLHGSLPLDRVQRLNEVGFVWQIMEKTPEKKSWIERFREYQMFRKKHGHDVLRHCPENPGLSSWVTEQRNEKARLSDEKKRLLEEAGFDWAPHETLWKKRYQELKAFHKEHGHCYVPRKWEKNPQLGTWVWVQRLQRDPGPDRRRKLDRLGFDWTKRAMSLKSWEERFEELQAFRAKYGHCNVPAHWTENHALGAWAYQQRLKRRIHTLSPERIQKLDQLGFEWNVRTRRKYAAPK